MARPSGYRRTRIEKFFNSLRVRRSILKTQLEQQEFQSMKPFIQGELKALETVIGEMKKEFDLFDSDDYPDLNPGEMEKKYIEWEKDGNQ